MPRQLLKWTLRAGVALAVLVAALVAFVLWRQSQVEAWDAKARAAHSTAGFPSVGREACEHGVDWACLSYADNVTFSRMLGGPVEALRWFQRGCSLGDATACRRMAGAHRCGRGVPVDIPKAIQQYEGLCSEGDVEACDVHSEFALDGLAGFKVVTPRMKMQVASLALSRLDRPRFSRALEELEKSGSTDEALFLRTCDALERDKLDEAERGARDLLARSPNDPAARMLKLLTEERRAGTPWAEAFFRAWGMAGRPDLRRTRYLPWSAHSDYFACDPQAPLGNLPAGAGDAFLVQAHRHLSASPAVLRGPLPPELLATTLRIADDEDADEVVQMAVIALSVGLAPEDPARERLGPVAARLTARLGTAHPDNLFFVLLASTWPAQRPNEALTVIELELLEAHLGDAYAPPHRAVFDRLERIWTETGLARPADEAFPQMVDLLSPWGGSELSQRAEKLALAQPELKPRVARMLQSIGQSVEKGGWLLEAMIGTAFQLKAARLNDSAEGEALVTARRSQLRQFTRWGSWAFAEAGAWPLAALDRDRLRRGANEELKFLERLAEIAASFPPDAGQ